MAKPRLDLAARTASLAAAADAGRGRLDAELIARADAVVARAGERSALSAEHTVVALAGSTGSGKSSLFNALVGSELARTGVRRPTTSRALAAVRGRGAEELLDWLEVAQRHDLGPAERARGGGMVLLDLPDHDSVVAEHRVRAEVLVERADLLVWVVDPQKYADAALHERYLVPLAGHQDVVVIVLNQIDRLTPEQAGQCLADLARLAARDGLDGVRVLGVSARTGDGMPALRALLAEASMRRQAATARLAADHRSIARELLDAAGSEPVRRAADGAHARLVAALAAAAGVDTVVAAVRSAAKRDARAATGWPPTRWIGRMRVDPLRRIGLRGAGERPDLARTSLPTASPSSSAAAATAVRAYVDETTEGAGLEWVLAARAKSAAALPALPDGLDQAVAGAPLETGRRPIWWRLVGAAQWIVLAIAVGGLAWLGVLAAFAYLQLPPPPTPQLEGLPWPTVLAIGGALLGLLLALLSRALAAVGAARRARRARGRLHVRLAEVASRLVVDPVAGELTALAELREQAGRAAV